MNLRNRDTPYSWKVVAFFFIYIISYYIQTFKCRDSSRKFIEIPLCIPAEIAPKIMLQSQEVPPGIPGISSEISQGISQWICLMIPPGFYLFYAKPRNSCRNFSRAFSVNFFKGSCRNSSRDSSRSLAVTYGGRDAEEEICEAIFI